MSNPAELALLECAQSGDEYAFEQLRARLEPPVRRFVWRLIGSNDAEDDIVQDSFIALYRNLHKIRPLEKLRPYLFRVVRNRCYDELRRLGRYQDISLDDEPVEMWVSFATQTDTSSPQEELAHWLLLHIEVQEAMLRLPELQRQTLILYAEEEMSYAEIAEAMKTSIGTVKSRLFYAKKTLRGLLSLETVQALDTAFGKTERQED